MAFRQVHRRLPRLLIAAVLFCLPAGCAQKARQAGDTAGVPMVRVRLLESQSQVTVASSESLAFREAPGLQPRALSVPRKQAVPVQRTTAGWRIGNVSVDSNELTFIPVGEGGLLSVNGKPYHGDFRLVPVAPGKFDVVNDVDLENYLKGVVAKELVRDWHEEAYKAQAIVARTYALYEVKTASAGRHFDLYPDERSQVYGGVGGENGLSRSATEATAGVVVAYGTPGQERIFKAYFSSCCGGITQSAADAFGDRPLEPLSDQNVGARCNNSPHFNWASPFVIRKDELARRLRTWGASRNRSEQQIIGVARLDIAFANRWGRPIRFMITDTNGQRYSIGGTELRMAINSGSSPTEPKVKSSFFTPFDEPETIRFVDGHGFGHGVGLCQYCAQAQAEQGIPHEQIILNAYPGASLQRAY
jgi:stage II sporulation protein D